VTTSERPLPRAETRALFFRRMAVAFMAAALMVALGAVLYIAVQIRGTQIEGSPTGKRIESCTTPGKPCYDRGQAQTAKAVAQLLTGNVNALACAMQVPPGTTVDETIDLITACLRRLPVDR
jgi:hypothetical protein